MAIRNKVIRLGIDIDGVLANFIREFTILARDIYGPEKCHIIENESDIVSWDFQDYYPLNDKEINKVWDTINEMRNFWLNLKLVDERGWNLFKKEFHLNKDYIVYFITSRENGINLHQQTVDWLVSKGWIFPQVILSKNKRNVINALEIDYFIDDKLITCLDAYNKCKSCKTFIYDYPHNKYPDFVNRVKNLQEFTDIVINQ